MNPIQGRIGIGSSGRFLVAQHIIDELIGGKELADVIDQLSGKTDVRSSWVSTAIDTLDPRLTRTRV